MRSLKIFFTVVLLFSIQIVFAQPDPCPCDPFDPGYDACVAANPGCDPDIPITDGLPFLVGAGVVLGLWVAYNKQKKVALD
jgi:hypothetical protein